MFALILNRVLLQEPDHMMLVYLKAFCCMGLDNKMLIY